VVGGGTCTFAVCSEPVSVGVSGIVSGEVGDRVFSVFSVDIAVLSLVFLIAIALARGLLTDCGMPVRRSVQQVDAG
jgi:hypothetical protein